MRLVKTKDNSITFYNKEAKDYYHSQSGAREEAFEKHAKALKVSSKKSPIIFDICFGLGYNTTAALDLIKGKIKIYCFENDKKILKQILKINADFKSYPIIKEFVKNFLEKNKIIYKKDNIRLIMVFGDAKEKIKIIKNKADFVFFDPFSPAKVPEMWTKEFFKNIKEKMKKGAKLSTYSSAKFVKENLKKAGFEIKKGPIIGRRTPSTIAIRK